MKFANEAEHYAHDASRCFEVVGSSGEHIMQPSKLQECSGFVFLTSCKGALVGNVESGHGVLIQCVGVDERARRQYSAPVPLETTRVGVGLSIGYEKLYSILLLRCPEACVHVAHGIGLEGGDIEVPGVSKDVEHHTHKHKRSILLSCDLMPGQAEADVYSASKGVMIADMTYSGGHIGPNTHLLHEWYGKDVRPLDVLTRKYATCSGPVWLHVSDQAQDIKPPPEFASLYKFLAELEGEGVPLAAVLDAAHAAKPAVSAH